MTDGNVYLGKHGTAWGRCFSHFMPRDWGKYFPLADHDQHVKPWEGLSPESPMTGEGIYLGIHGLSGGGVFPI